MNEFEPKEKIIENASILIVDDEIETLEIFSRQLSGDFDVDVVQSAYLALEMMKKKSYHIALTDLVMPGEDGLELLASIKKEWPNTAVIVISGKASIDMAVKAIKL
ncbi:MAG TPA: response regulator, partial [Bacteroidetes bacterium]|nr:response regulator [Bacteroidota bacterium]